MLPSRELLETFSVEIFEKILQYDFVYLNVSINASNYFNNFYQYLGFYKLNFIIIPNDFNNFLVIKKE